MLFFTSRMCAYLIYLKPAAGENDTVYIEYTTQWQGLFNSSSVTIYNSATLPPGNYTELAFATALDQQLNSATNGAVRADYNSPNNVCSIYTNGDTTAFRILTDDEVVAHFNTSGNTINEIINNIITPSPTYGDNNSMTINRLRLQPIHNIYITSPNLGSYDTVSNFSDNIIKQVPVTSDYGYMIVDRLVSFADYLNCPNATLKTLEFHMRDGRGRYVNLYNNHISFTIVFDTK